MAMWLLILAAVLSPFRANAAPDPDSPEIPVGSDSPTLRAATEDVRATLAGAPWTPPAAETAGIHPFVTADGRYVLAGDLFGNAQRYALVELHYDRMAADQPGTALAVWREGNWELRGLWKFVPTWRPAGWKNGDDDYLPATPEQQPFWMERLIGDSAPYAVVAADVEKYRQEHFVLRFDAKADRLRLVGDSYAKPEFLPGGWLRLYFDSGRRAIWEEWDYLQWNGRDLMPRADWHDEVPYNNVDPAFIEVTLYDPQGRSANVIHAEELQSQDGYRVNQKGFPFAKVIFVPRHPLARYPMDGGSSEKAYLFEKLTGLPRWLYPSPGDGGKPFTSGKPPPRLERQMRVRVSGGALAARLLGAPMGRGGF